MNLRRDGVESRYAVQRDCRANDGGDDGAGFADEGACLGVLEVDFGPAILLGFTVARYATCLLVKEVSRVLPETRTPGPSANVPQNSLVSSCRVMHRLAHGLAKAGCSSTRAARLTTSSWRSTTAAAATSSAPTASSRRTIHVRVPLPYKIENGMSDFLPPAALKVIAEDYQQGLLDRLNEQIKGTFSWMLAGIYS